MEQEPFWITEDVRFRCKIWQKQFIYDYEVMVTQIINWVQWRVYSAVNRVIIDSYNVLFLNRRPGFTQKRQGLHDSLKISNQLRWN